MSNLCPNSPDPQLVEKSSYSYDKQESQYNRLSIVYKSHNHSHSLLSSISVFLTIQKKIQTPHCLFLDFYNQPLQQVGQAAEFKFGSKFEPLLIVWQSLQKADSKDVIAKSKVLIAKSMA